ncbi:hypothetical protein SCHPADRAFT_823890 [Schizopora paradoxa]|uniref:F-box domain-containing protein n=1 Tax=Schizopora paradoxa TaxID=27342 RepID=A0A0H2S2K7_9AGAM|nr:hypothetical protein SCHPADRAFT_823890 [Schizopora paradoxa]
MPSLFSKASQHSVHLQSSKSALPSLNTSFSRASSSSTVTRSPTLKRSPTSPVRASYLSNSSRSHSGSSTAYDGYRHSDQTVHSPKAHSQSSRRSPTHSGDRQKWNANTIPHLREALDTLESQMATLAFERKMLERKLEKAVRLQSPVQRLPGELLGYIFLVGALQQDSQDTILLSTLMLVCKDWAEVAKKTPALWSRIVIENSASLAKARFKLDRSKGVPVDITIQFSPHFEHTRTITELVVHAMDILRPAIWRWRTFRIAVPSRAHAHAALTQCKEPAPLLEELSVQIHHFMQEDRFSKPPLPLFQGHLPSLRTCSFTSFNFGWDMALVSRLRVLKLGGYWNGFAPSADIIMNILRACPALEELALRNMTDVDGGGCSEFSQFDRREEPTSYSHSTYFPKATDMVHMPRLRRASFYNAGAERMHAIFSQLSFPALERVEFAYMDNLSPILKHLKRQVFTSLPLTHFRIESCYFNELKFMQLLARFPLLKTLELIDVEDISSNFLNGLSAHPPTQDWICPRLETLSFDGCSTVNWDALRGLVESRLPANSSSRMVKPPNKDFVRGNTLLSSSASSYAAQQQNRHSSSVSSSFSSSVSTGGSTGTKYATNRASGTVPKRLKTLDLTRCHQISQEMIQWLRMYVSEVRCDSVKTYWGEYGFSSS